MVSATRKENNIEAALWQAVQLVINNISYPAENIPVLQGFDPNFLTGCQSHSQHLFYGVIRNLRLLDSMLGEMIHNPPRKGMQALLRVSAYEVLESRNEKERIPRVIDHAVSHAGRRFSRPESGMVNAILRRFARELDARLNGFNRNSPHDLGILHSHPQWLVDRWVDFRGLGAARELLQWNQRHPETYVAVRSGIVAGKDSGLGKTDWNGFFRIRDSRGWEKAEKWIREGMAYIQDPATALGPAQARVLPGMSVLDLCAAPGGKAWQLSGYDPGLLVQVDLPPRGSGVRHAQWRENAKHLGVRTRMIECDLLRDNLETRLEEVAGCLAFDRVYIDVPCSNTGVIRRRPEVRWRLTPASFKEQAFRQKKILAHGARFVKHGGRLIYSTCSLEPEENEEVASWFSGERGNAFTRVEGTLALPWEVGHDGAGIHIWERTHESGSGPLGIG